MDSEPEDPFEDLPFFSDDEDASPDPLPRSGLGPPPIIVEWLGMIINAMPNLKESAIALRTAAGLGITASMLHDPHQIETLAQMLPDALTALRACQPTVCRRRGFHRLLFDAAALPAQFIQHDGWQRRGFRTTALQAVFGALLIERVTVALWETGNAQSYSVAMGPGSWWLREMLNIK